ncbi:MAG: Serine-rich adhesin, platelet-type [Parcubacteria group bacterium GW2011_GWA2_47_10]|nr:MAG: Serine-rich adhesin, platelet-type [Parcubacteria group bacterium GW2011_GWA2_47_10]
MLAAGWGFFGWPQFSGFPQKIHEAKASPGARAKTVEILAGQYAGDGLGGQNSNTNQSFAESNFNLAESSVSVKNAFVVVEMQLNGAADRGNATGHLLSFDACANPCTADPWAGSGRVEDNQGSTILQYQDITGAMYVRLLIDVTKETQLAAYTGSDSTMDFMVGYRVNNGATAATIDSAKAKLFITYTYDDTSASITNTVIYPLESTASGDQGTRRASQASACTKGTNCPTFTYNMDTAEFSEKISQWFEVGGFNDLNSGTDVTRNINIEGTDVDSSTFYHEAAQASGQGNWSQAWWSGVSGFAENTAQTLEHYFAAGTQYLIGGEVFETYTASSSAATKTRTISFPIGVITNDILSTGVDYSATTTVYFAESGVSIKKAWLRILETGDDATGAHTFSVKTEVGANAQSAASVYNQDTPAVMIIMTNPIIHVIPSSDYTELAAATASSGKDVGVAVQSNSAEIDGVSAELMITYTYTGEANGYLTSLASFAGQTATAGVSQSETLSNMATSTLPETTGAKTMRAAALRASYAASESTAAMLQSDSFTVDTNLSTGSPTCSNAYESATDLADAYMEFYKLVTSAMNTTDGQEYSVCYTNDGAGDAQTGAKMNGWLIYTYQWDAPPNIFVSSATPTLDVRVPPSSATTTVPAIKILATAASQITTSGIRINIDPNFPLLWDGACSGSTTPAFSGSAAGKITAANSGFICSSGSARTFYIDVDTTFDSGDDIIITSGVSWGATSTAFAASTTLSLSIDGGVTRAKTATSSIAVKGILAVSDHSAGQITDQFADMLETETSTSSELFRFKLAPNGESASTTLKLTYTTSGIDDGDIASGDIYVDTDANGRVNGAEATAGFNCSPPSGGTITCNGTTTVSAATNYIYKATVSNLATGDSITFDTISTSNVVGIGATSKTYTSRLTTTASMNSATHQKSKIIAFSSDYSQNFLLDGSLAAMAPITIRVYANQKATTSTGFRIKIPTTLDFTWDITDQSASTGGNAANKVDAVVVFPDTKTLYITINTDFIAGDEVQIGGLSFKNFSSISGPDSLQLYTGGADDAGVDAIDNKIKQVVGVMGTGAATATDAAPFAIPLGGGLQNSGVGTPVEPPPFEQPQGGGTDQGGGTTPSE